MVKMLFLFQKEGLSRFKKGTNVTEENFYEFFPWDFGPFSKQVYDDLTFLTLRGFIEAEQSEDEVLPEAAAEWREWMNFSSSESDTDEVDEYDEQLYRLTDKGLDFAKGLYSTLKEEQKHLLKAFKAQITKSTLRALLKYVYNKYPEFTTHSKIADKVLKY